MRKRLVAGALTVLMALSLCACGSDVKEIKGVPGEFGTDVKVDVDVPDVDVDVNVPDIDEPDVDVDVNVPDIDEPDVDVDVNVPDVDEPDVDVDVDVNVPDIDEPDVDVDVNVPDIDEPEMPSTVGAGGYDSLENLTFAYPEGWVLEVKEGNSVTYANYNGTEAISVSASPIDDSLTDDDVRAQVPGVIEMYYGAYDSESTFYAMGREWAMYTYENLEVDGQFVSMDIYSMVENRTIVIVGYAYQKGLTDKTSAVDVVLDSLVVEDVTGGNGYDDPIADAGNLETFNNVIYSLGDTWNYLNESDGTRTYNTTDLSEAFAIYVQNETGYSSDELQEAYKQTVEATFGTDYMIENVVIGDYTWRHYYYETVSLIEGYSVDVFVYSDGATTIYVENAYPQANGYSGKINIVLESITIY